MALEVLTSWSLRSSGILRSYSGKSLPTFRNNWSVRSSRVNKSNEKFSSWNSWTLNIRPISFSETSVRSCHYTTHDIPEESRSHICLDGSLRTSILTLSPLSEVTNHSPSQKGSVITIRTSNFSPELWFPFALLCHSELVIWTAEERRISSCYALPSGNFRCFDP